MDWLLDWILHTENHQSSWIAVTSSLFVPPSIKCFSLWKIWACGKICTKAEANRQHEGASSKECLDSSLDLVWGAQSSGEAWSTVATTPHQKDSVEVGVWLLLYNAQIQNTSWGLQPTHRPLNPAHCILKEKQSNPPKNQYEPALCLKILQAMSL